MGYIVKGHSIFRSSWKTITLFLILIIISYVFIDRPLTYYFQTAAPWLRSVSRFASIITVPTIHAIGWPIAFFIVRFLFKNRAWGRKLLFIAVTVNFAWLVSFLLKIAFGRYRPEMLFTEGLYGFSFFSTHELQHSFPSGHGVNIGALVGSFACLYPRAFLPLLTGGLLLAFSRVILLQHYLSDILFGLLVGMLCAQWVYTKITGRIGF
jgi:membrane-associated phospholipid phosphatase